MKKIAEKKGIGLCVVNNAIGSKMKRYLATGVVKGGWGSKITGKFAAATGGEVKMIMTGSAPIDPLVLNTMKVLLSINIIEG